MTFARNSSSALANRGKFSASDKTAKSVSRLNSAAPYNTHAWPPIKRHCTRCAFIEKRTLSIGLGVKRTSQQQVRRPKLLALAPALLGRHSIPLCPFSADDVFGVDHRIISVRASGSAPTSYSSPSKTPRYSASSAVVSSATPSLPGRSCRAAPGAARTRGDIHLRPSASLLYACRCG